MGGKGGGGGGGEGGSNFTSMCLCTAGIIQLIISLMMHFSSFTYIGIGIVEGLARGACASEEETSMSSLLVGNDNLIRRKQCLMHLYSAHKANRIMKVESIDCGVVDVVGKEEERRAFTGSGG